jgi:hypothetical protein
MAAIEQIGRIGRLVQILQDASHVKKKFGKSYVAQLREIARLRAGYGRIGTAEYYFYNLYDDRKFTWDDKTRFLGWRMQDIVDSCAHREWWASVEDKLLLYGYLKGLGFPIPRIIALYHAYRTFERVPSFCSPEALRDYLVQSRDYPFFSKPNARGKGEAAMGVVQIDPAGEMLHLINGQGIGMTEYLATAERYRNDGYVLQEMLEPSSFIEHVCGKRISTVRAVVIVDEGGPELYAAAWRIPAGNNMVDNFSQPGNLLAGVDIESGAVNRVCSGFGIGQSIVERHPDTGFLLNRLQLPDWKCIRDLCLDVAATLPGVRVQAWDIAMCQSGPIILEANIGGDIDVPQVANATGLLTPELRAFMDRYAAH